MCVWDNKTTFVYVYSCIFYGKTISYKGVVAYALATMVILSTIAKAKSKQC